MLTNDGGSEDMELEEALARAGLNLPVIVENWKKQGIETVSEEEIKTISDLFTKRQEAELERKHRRLGVAKGNGFHPKILLGNTSSSRHKKKRGRKKSNEALQELGMLMITSRKMKALSAFPSFQ